MAGLSRGALALLALGTAVRATPCKSQAAKIMDLGFKSMLISIL
jgi:hypothetical protein